MRKTAWPIFVLLNGLFLYSCSKKDSSRLHIGESLSLKDEIVLIKDSFEIRNLSPKLKSTFGADKQLLWAPEWNRLYKIRKSSAQSFYYIPLIPKIINNDGTPFKGNILQSGYRKYLLVSATNSGLEYTKAFYFPDSTVEKPFQNPLPDHLFFKKFTGSLFAYGLDRGKYHEYKYKNAVIDRDSKIRLKRMMSIQPVSNGHIEYICDIRHICNWGGQCSNGNVAITATFDSPCTAPAVGPECDANAVWVLTNEHDETISCDGIWIEDPPPPDDPENPENPDPEDPYYPFDPNGGEDGGNNPYGIILDTDPDYICSSNFNFTISTDHDLWQTAKINTLYTNLVYLDGSAWWESKVKQVNIDYIYIQMPYYNSAGELIYTPTRAAELAADAVNWGEYKMRDFFSRNKDASPETLANIWIYEAKKDLQAHTNNNGTIGKIGPLNPKNPPGDKKYVACRP